MLEQTFNGPERLGDEPRDLIVAVDDEAKCRELTGTVRDHFHLCGELRAERRAQTQRLQTSEGTADAQVELLAHVHRVVRCFVQCCEGAQSSVH